MLLQFPKNPVADYQQVTDIEILPDFQNNFPLMDFIARKLRWQKSKCKENHSFSDKMILFRFAENTRIYFLAISFY